VRHKHIPAARRPPPPFCSSFCGYGRGWITPVGAICLEADFISDLVVLKFALREARSLNQGRLVARGG